MQNNPISYNDPTGHMLDKGDGGGDNTVDCNKYPQYCKNGEPKSTDELLEMRSKKKSEEEQKLEYCTNGNNWMSSQCNFPQASIQPLPIEYDFIAPWELDKLDAWGFRFNLTVCRVICLFDVSFDLLGNSMLREGTLFVTPSTPSGAFGWGEDASIGLVAAYDAPDMESLAGAGTTSGGNATLVLGVQGSYGLSASPNVTGNYAQTWSIALSTGKEVSAGRSAGYSFPVFTLDEKNFYKGLKIR